MSDPFVNRKEWIRCSTVSVCFYLIVYVLLAMTWFSFTNGWLILGVVVFAIADIFALKWLLRDYSDKDNDLFP